MNMYTTTFARVSAAALVAALFIPQAFVSAAVTERPTATPGTAFCKNLGTLSANITARIPKRQSMRDQAVTKITTNSGNRIQLKNTKLDDNRTKRSQDLQSNFAKLEARASTTEQQAAVKTYEAAITAAVTARDSAVDAAVSAYQTGVNTALTSRQTELDSAFTTLTTATQSALTTASTACASATANGQAIRTQLSADIKAANEAFKAATKAKDSTSTTSGYKSTRDAAVKAAMTTFQTAVQQANAALKTAFGK